MTDQTIPQKIHHDDPRKPNDVETNNAGVEADRTFDPTGVEASRTREQGNGVGQRELDRQQDPSGVDPGGGEHSARDAAMDGG